jgi:hypothetical protein
VEQVLSTVWLHFVGADKLDGTACSGPGDGGHWYAEAAKFFSKNRVTSDPKETLSGGRVTGMFEKTRL